MQDFPANSQKAKARSEAPMPRERPEKIERVTSAEARRRKRGLGRQFKETFIGGNAKMAVEYMAMEIVVPAIRDTLNDALQGGIERVIYGESRIRRGTASQAYSNVGHVNYQGLNTAARPSRSQASQTLSQRSRSRHKFDEIVIPNRVEAEEVLDRMFETLSRFGMVTVGELYAMTGIQSSHIDNKWGWTQLRGANIDRLRNNGGYVLNLPEPESLS